MSQGSIEAFYSRVFARLALFMEDAFECTGVDILSYKVAEH